MDATAPEPALLWNGLIGVRIGRDGTGVGVDGKPLGFFAIDEYDTTGEEKIRSLPNPLPTGFADGNTPINLKGGASGYEQTLDMKTGILGTRWQTAVNGSVVEVTILTVVHPDKRIIAQRWAVSSNKPLSKIGFAPAPGIGPGKPDPKRPLTSVQDGYWGPSKTPMHLEVTGGGGDGTAKPFMIDYVFSLGDSPNRKAMKLPPLEPQPAKGLSFDQIVTTTARTWGDKWKTDIEIDGPIEDQQAVRSFLFYLRSAVHPKGGMSISPMALSDTQYNGHIFWDADIWVAPALAFVDPKETADIAQYRIDKAAAAHENYTRWIAAGRPIANGTVAPKSSAVLASNGTMYPWESSVSGRETVPGPSQFEHHITGSVLWSLDRAAQLGLVDSAKVDAIGKQAATFYLNRADPASGLQASLRGTMSPDENHTGDNDLYTNVLANWTLQRFIPASSKPQPTFVLPKDDTSFLTYDGDLVRSYKQAAAVLAIYPLEFPPAEAQAAAMMARFADKAIKNGPAMTDSVHATIWARLGDTDKAYETWRASWQPFTSHPLMLFSEKRSRAATYFTTGAAGSLQSVIYGLLGFRIDSKKEPSAVWSTALRQGSWLNIKPNLPKSWKSVKFKNFTVLGRPYTLIVTPEDPGKPATVTQGE